MGIRRKMVSIGQKSKKILKESKKQLRIKPDKLLNIYSDNKNCNFHIYFQGLKAKSHQTSLNFPFYKEHHKLFSKKNNTSTYIILGLRKE